jgi:hypothetical protein
VSLLIEVSTASVAAPSTVPQVHFASTQWRSYTQKSCLVDFWVSARSFSPRHSLYNRTELVGRDPFSGHLRALAAAAKNERVSIVYTCTLSDLA